MEREATSQIWMSGKLMSGVLRPAEEGCVFWILNSHPQRGDIRDTEFEWTIMKVTAMDCGQLLGGNLGNIY